MNERQAIYDLIADYGWYADKRDLKACLGLFTDDASLESPAAGLSLEGREEISDFLSARWKKISDSGEQRRHIITGIRLSDMTDNSGSYRALVSLVVNPAEGEPRITTTGYYIGRLVRISPGWRISHLEVHTD